MASKEKVGTSQEEKQNSRLDSKFFPKTKKMTKMTKDFPWRKRCEKDTISS